MSKQKEKANIDRRSENGSPRSTVAVAHQNRGASGSGFHREKKDEWAHKDSLFWDFHDEETDEKGEE
jgi:hypothetical protein